MPRREAYCRRDAKEAARGEVIVYRLPGAQSKMERLGSWKKFAANRLDELNSEDRLFLGSSNFPRCQFLKINGTFVHQIIPGFAKALTASQDVLLANPQQPKLLFIGCYSLNLLIEIFAEPRTADDTQECPQVHACEGDGNAALLE